MKTDIRTEEDVRVLVDSFYDAVRQDDMLAPIFKEVIGDQWDDHLRIMVGFWTTLLIEHRAYPGQPFAKHAHLPLAKAHFDRWLRYFRGAIDARFEGETADEAKRLAGQIAIAFIHKMGIENQVGNCGP